MIVKINKINPKSSEKNKIIKCRDCELSYSFGEYEILEKVKKLVYLNIHEDTKHAYCQVCCMKRLSYIKTQFDNIVFILVDKKENKIIDID